MNNEVEAENPLNKKKNIAETILETWETPLTATDKIIFEVN